MALMSHGLTFTLMGAQNDCLFPVPFSDAFDYHSADFLFILFLFAGSENKI